MKAANTQRDALLSMPDDELFRNCRTDVFRGSGRGGQKRNVTNSAVRVTHEPSGISAECDKTRSQHSNRHEALKLLRRAIALQWREPLPSDFAGLPAKPSRKNKSFPQWVALALDLLAANDWQVGNAARQGGTSTGRFVKDLADDQGVWEEVNRQRQALGLKPLRAS